MSRSYSKLASLAYAAILSSCVVTAAPSSQHVLEIDQPVQHLVSPSILSALDTYTDPVQALISLRPDLNTELNEPRLIHVTGEEEAVWMSEGDKLRLRKDGRKFVDITRHQSAAHMTKSNSTARMFLPTPPYS